MNTIIQEVRRKIIKDNNKNLEKLICRYEGNLIIYYGYKGNA
jgi:hypothetical protein